MHGLRRLSTVLALVAATATAPALLTGCGGGDAGESGAGGSSTVPANVENELKQKMGNVTGPAARSAPGSPGAPGGR